MRFSCTKRTFHKYATIAWLVVGGIVSYIYPTSIAWLTFMSLYANIVGHWGAYEAADSNQCDTGEKK